MTKGYVAIANTYQVPNSPIVLNYGEYIITDTGYQCIKKLPINTGAFVSLDKNNLAIINQNTLQCSKTGSYTILVYLSNTLIPFSFRIYDTIFIQNKELILQIINQELPTIYQSSNQLNNADNVGMASIFAKLYANIYTSFYNVLTSVGSGESYNSNWEYVYVGINNFLQNAKYPAEFLKTLMQVHSKTSVQTFSLAITISKLVYQFLGTNAGVAIYYDFPDNEYKINIYSTRGIGWQLGVAGRSELGITTVLGDPNESPYLFIICKIIHRLMPVQVKYLITQLPITMFKTIYNTDEVNNNYFIDQNIQYDAYMAVNNNNIFNIQGFRLR